MTTIATETTPIAIEPMRKHRARRAEVERDQDGAAGERDQRVDRLFGERRRTRVSMTPPCMAWRTSIAAPISTKNEAAASMTSRGRPPVVRASCQAAKAAPSAGTP